MEWVVEYYEQRNGAQPAEVFEDALFRALPKLARLVLQLQSDGYGLGGGYLEPCHDYAGLWEVRAIHGGSLARELLGFDQRRVVLLHGYRKRVGEPASIRDLNLAFSYWADYTRERRLSPGKE